MKTLFLILALVAMQPAIADIGVFSKEAYPNCPVPAKVYTCTALSPVGMGVGYSSSRFEAQFKALVDCDLDSQDSQSCKVVDCI